MKHSPRASLSVLLHSTALLVLITAHGVFAQDERGTVRNDSLQVYSKMSADSDGVATLPRGTAVLITFSITNDEGTWCNVSSIDTAAKLGFVRCDGLDRPNRPSVPVAAGEMALQPTGPASPPPTRAQRAWALAASAILSGYNHDSSNTLAPGGQTEAQKKRLKRLLQEWWGIGNRDDLLKALAWIEQGGHRQVFSDLGARTSELGPEDLKTFVGPLDSENAHSVVVARQYYKKLGSQSITGWDYGRYINLCRWGVQVGYLSEDEAWPRVMSAARILQKTFGSWQEFGENYLIGREFWSLRQTQKDGPAMRANYSGLVDDHSSPWNLIPWGLALQ